MENWKIIVLDGLLSNIVFSFGRFMYLVCTHRQQRSVGYRRPERTAILSPPKVVRCLISPLSPPFLPPTPESHLERSATSTCPRYVTAYRLWLKWTGTCQNWVPAFQVPAKSSPLVMGPTFTKFLPEPWYWAALSSNSEEEEDIYLAQTVWQWQ